MPLCLCGYDPLAIGVDEKIGRFEIRGKSIIMCRWE